MKILQVSHSFYPCVDSGGVVRVVYELSKELVAKGHSVTVYTTDGCTKRLSVKKNSIVQVDGVNVYYFRNLSNKLRVKLKIATPYALFRVIRKDIKNFDIIHIHEPRTILAAIICYYARKNNIPYVIQAHGSIMPFFQKVRLKKIFDTIWGYKILKYAKVVIAGSSAETMQYLEMGVIKNKIEIIPNAVDYSQFENIPKGMFRKKYGIDEKDKIILYLGRINRIKGIDLLINSFKQLNHVENIKLVLIGPDDGYLSKLKMQMDGVSGDRIIYTGLVSETTKLEAYADADIYVLPSIKDNFPISVLEALASSTPVIVTNGCLIANIIRKVGFVVDNDIESLNKAIFELLDNDKLRYSLGKKSRNLIKSKFTYQKIVEQFEELYDKIIRGDYY